MPVESLCKKLAWKLICCGSLPRSTRDGTRLEEASSNGNRPSKHWPWGDAATVFAAAGCSTPNATATTLSAEDHLLEMLSITASFDPQIAARGSIQSDDNHSGGMSLANIMQAYSSAVQSSKKANSGTMCVSRQSSQAQIADGETQHSLFEECLEPLPGKDDDNVPHGAWGIGVGKHGTAAAHPTFWSSQMSCKAATMVIRALPDNSSDENVSNGEKPLPFASAMSREDVQVPSAKSVILGETPIGRGSTGLVFKGCWIGRDVAVKVMSHVSDTAQTSYSQAPRTMNLGSASQADDLFSASGLVSRAPSNTNLIRGAYGGPNKVNSCFTTPRGSSAGMPALQDSSKEALLAMTLKHPNIVATYGYYHVTRPGRQPSSNVRTLAWSRSKSGFSMPANISNSNVQSKSLTDHVKVDKKASFDVVETVQEVSRQPYDHMQDLPSPKSGSQRSRSMAGCDAQAFGGSASPTPSTMQTCIVMEYCAAGSLRKVLDASKSEPLPIHLVLSLCWDITSALDYMHSQQIRHGDVKASNVLLCPDNSSTSTGYLKHYVAKLSDFGTSRFMEVEEEEELHADSNIAVEGSVLEARYTSLQNIPVRQPNFTKGGSFSCKQTVARVSPAHAVARRKSRCGPWLPESQVADAALTAGTDASGMFTPSHSAPELLVGRMAPSLSDDVYALGVTYWEIITREKAYNKMQNLDLIQNKLCQPTQSMLLFPEGYHTDLVRLCQTCWKPAATRPTMSGVKASLCGIMQELHPNKL